MTGRKLGRGLDMLIPKEPEVAGVEVLQLDPQTIGPNPDQPRKKFSMNELEMLKTSISREGLLQPVVVRRAGDGYQLVVGERRLRASQELGLPNIPAIVCSVGDDRLLELALVENVQREDLNPIELAAAYRQLMEVKRWTQEVLAETLGLSRPAVSNTLRLLELPEDMRNALVRGHINMGHAKVLLSVGNPKDQRVLFERIAEEKLSVRDLEEAREETPPGGEAKDDHSKPSRRPRVDDRPPHVVSMEERLGERFGTKVRIKERKGRGRIVIEFYGPEDFDRIRTIMIPEASPS
jgi:ParB family chromosome partitioning protein